MPRWWGRAWSVFRRRRMVMVHFRDAGAASVSGFYRGVWAGHYIIEAPKLHETVDKAVPLDGMLEIPRDRVLYLQTMIAVAS